MSAQLDFHDCQQKPTCKIAGRLFRAVPAISRIKRYLHADIFSEATALERKEKSTKERANFLPKAVDRL